MARSVDGNPAPHEVGIVFGDSLPSKWHHREFHMLVPLADGLQLGLRYEMYAELALVGVSCSLDSSMTVVQTVLLCLPCCL